MSSHENRVITLEARRTPSLEQRTVAFERSVRHAPAAIAEQRRKAFMRGCTDRELVQLIQREHPDFPDSPTEQQLELVARGEWCGLPPAA